MINLHELKREKYYPNYAKVDINFNVEDFTAAIQRLNEAVRRANATFTYNNFRAGVRPVIAPIRITDVT